MSNSLRYRLALASYWMLFIIAPTTGLVAILGPSESASIAVGLVVLFVLIGERGFRPWKRLWKVDSDSQLPR